MGFTVSAHVFYYYVCQASKKTLQACISPLAASDIQMLTDLEDIHYLEDDEQEEENDKEDNKEKTYYVGYVMYHSSYKCSEISTETFPWEYLKDLGDKLSVYKTSSDMKVSVKLTMSA